MSDRAKEVTIGVGETGKRKGKTKRYFTRLPNSLSCVRSDSTVVVNGTVIKTQPIWVKWQGNFFVTDDLEIQEAIENDPLFNRQYWEDKPSEGAITHDEVVDEAPEEPQSDPLKPGPEPTYSSGAVSSQDRVNERVPDETQQPKAPSRRGRPRKNG